MPYDCLFRYRASSVNDSVNGSVNGSDPASRAYSISTVDESGYLAPASLRGSMGGGSSIDRISSTMPSVSDYAGSQAGSHTPYSLPSPHNGYDVPDRHQPQQGGIHAPFNAQVAQRMPSPSAPSQHQVRTGQGMHGAYGSARGGHANQTPLATTRAIYCPTFDFRKTVIPHTPRVCCCTADQNR